MRRSQADHQQPINIYSMCAAFGYSSARVESLLDEAKDDLIRHRAVLILTRIYREQCQ